jgi:hypothetical protein
VKNRNNDRKLTLMRALGVVFVIGIAVGLSFWGLL